MSSENPNINDPRVSRKEHQNWISDAEAAEQQRAIDNHRFKKIVKGMGKSASTP